MIVDPNNLLATNDWSTRAMIRSLGKAYSKSHPGMALQIRSGRRTCAQQNAIYAQGRTTPGALVTGASGCRSWHVTGRAVDLDPFDLTTGKKVPHGNHPDYVWLGYKWEKLGGGWGGRFSIYDPGHFEWHPKLDINTVCPIGMPCEQMKVRAETPAWVWITGGVTAAALAGGVYLAWKSP